MSAVCSHHGVEQLGENLADGRRILELAAETVERAIDVALQRRLIECLLVAVGVVEALAADAELLGQVGERGVLEPARPKKIEPEPVPELPLAAGAPRK